MRFPPPAKAGGFQRIILMKTISAKNKTGVFHLRPHAPQGALKDENVL